MKLKNLFNMPSIDTFSGSAKVFGDAAPGLVLGENLIQVDPKILERKYPDNVFLNSGLQADNTGGYAEAVRTLRLSENGGFETVGQKGGNKGKISLSNEDSLIKVYHRMAESNWSQTEVQQAAAQNINLPSSYVARHTKIYQRDIDSILALGIEGKTTGLLNNTDFTAVAASDTAANLAATSGDALYQEIANAINAQRNAVNNVEEYSADVMVFPTSVYNTLTTALLNSAGSEKSVLAALQTNFPQITFMSSHQSDELATSATVLYSTSEEAMVARIPQPLSFSPIEQRLFTFETASEYRIAGIDILEPKSGLILNGL